MGLAGMIPSAEVGMHCVETRPYLLWRLLNFHRGAQTQDATQGVTHHASRKSLPARPASPAACAACRTGKQRCEDELTSRPLQTRSACHVPTIRGMQQAHTGLVRFCCCSGEEPQNQRHSGTTTPASADQD